MSSEDPTSMKHYRPTCRSRSVCEWDMVKVLAVDQPEVGATSYAEQANYVSSGLSCRSTRQTQFSFGSLLCCQSSDTNELLVLDKLQSIHHVASKGALWMPRCSPRPTKSLSCLHALSPSNNSLPNSPTSPTLHPFLS